MASSVKKNSNKSYNYKYIKKVALVLALAILVQCWSIAGNDARAVVTSTLKLTVISSTQVSLDWSDLLVNEKQYIVERKTDSGSFIMVQTQAGDMTSCIDTFEVGHTYTYRLKVMDSNNSVYIYTNEVSINTQDIITPDSLIITPVSSNEIDLKWTYPDKQSYNTIVERKLESDKNWSQIARVGMGQNTYADINVASGVKYLYRVRQYYSDYVVTPAYPYEGSGAYTLLFKPTDLYGFAMSGHQIQLFWKDNSVEIAFIIERKSSKNGIFKEIAVVPQNNNSYIDSDPELEPDTTYAYRVKAVTGTSNSEYSDVVYITSTYLKPPGTLVSSCVNGKSIVLEWQDYTINETGFEIWRKTSSDSEWKLYETMGRNATTFTDINTSQDDNYTYKVRAKINDNSVYSDFSNETTVYTAIISAPSKLTYEVVGTTEIKLIWQDTSMVEAGFDVQRKIGPIGKWETIAYLDPNTVSYNDKWINNTDTYYYRIKVFDKSNSVNYSNEVMVTLKSPEAPSNLQAKAISSSEIMLTWKDNSINESHFIIEAMQLYSFKEVGRVSENTTTFTYKNINTDKTLTFRVRAVNGSKLSEPSNEVAAATKKKVTYSDISNVDWAVTAINNLASRSVFDAKSGSKFYPNQSISRGEYCAIVIRSLDLGMVAAGSYADMDSRHKYYKEMLSAAKLGLISPDKSNKIYPNNAITREQAGVILALAIKVKGTPLADKDSSILKEFADYRSISPASADRIADLCGAGIFTGRVIDGKNYLKPSGYVTRAEAAVMAYKAINL